MPDYYTFFCVKVPKVTLEEKNWWDLMGVRTEDAEGTSPEQAAFLKKFGREFDTTIFPDFELQVIDDMEWDKEKGEYVRSNYYAARLFSEDAGSVGQAAFLLHAFLKRFRKNEYLVLSYAMTCSKMEDGAFGGGSVFISAKEVIPVVPDDIVREHIKKFEERLNRKKGK
jgi:hypothetical protein